MTDREELTDEEWEQISQMGVEVNATKLQIEDFKESILWQDIKRELGMWGKGFSAEMMSIVDDAAGSNPSTASVLLHMGDLNGRVKAVDYFLGLPDVFLQILEEKEKEDESRLETTD